MLNDILQCRGPQLQKSLRWLLESPRSFGFSRPALWPPWDALLIIVDHRWSLAVGVWECQSWHWLHPGHVRDSIWCSFDANRPVQLVYEGDVALVWSDTRWLMNNQIWKKIGLTFRLRHSSTPHFWMALMALGMSLSLQQMLRNYVAATLVLKFHPREDTAWEPYHAAS